MAPYTLIGFRVEGVGGSDPNYRLHLVLKVYAALLSKSSPVLAAMVDSEMFAEARQAQMVITDFPAAIVELFLKFLYLAGS